MSPRTREQFQKIREERRQQIMSVALELFSREGYGHVSIAQLAGQTGISKGLMYNYFESKEQLLTEIVHQGLEQIAEIFDPNRDGVLTSDEFEYFIRKTFRSIREQPRYWGLFIGLILQPNVPPLLKKNPLVEFIGEYTSILLDYFERKGFEDPMLELLNI